VGGHHQFQNIDSPEQIKDKHLTLSIGFLHDILKLTRLLRKTRVP